KKTFAPPASSGGSTSSSGVATGFAPLESPAAGATAGGVASSAAPHVTIGFPPAASGTGPTTPIHPGALSFSGQGREIWQDSPASESSRTAQALGTSPLGTRAAAIQPAFIFRSRGFYPIFYPAFGFSPFFGLGWGCDPFSPWAWNYGCNGLGFGYGYGSGYGGAYYGGGYNNGYPPG